MPLYAFLCALTGLCGLTLSLTAHPDGVVYHLEQAAADEAPDAMGRTALILRDGGRAGTL